MKRVWSGTGLSISGVIEDLGDHVGKAVKKALHEEEVRVGV